MNHPADDELLSALLDGELAEDERAHVERLLAEQPESRQLLEELRAVKQRLESMPAARLGDDFADRVLRQAEREMLTEGFRVQGSGFSEPAADQEVPSGPQSKIENLKSKIGRHRRSVVWASLALAAGLLVMLFDRDRQRRPAEKQVAMAPQGAEQRRSGTLPRDAEIGAAPGGPAADEVERAPRDLSELSVERRLSEQDEKEDATALSKDKPQAARRRMTEPLNETVTERLGEANQGGRRTGSEPMNERFEFRGDSEGEAPLVDDQTLVVWCELSPDAPSEENFSQLLAQQNIAWQPPGDAEEGVNQPPGRAGGSKNTQNFFEQSQAGKNVSVDPDKLTDTLKRRGVQRATEEKAPALEALQSPGAQMVLVEATDAQVEAVLEAMDQDRDTYRTVEVEPAPQAPRQQSLAQYSRSARNLTKENSQRMGRMSVQNMAADPQLPQGRAMRVQLQARQPAVDAKADEAAAPPAPAPAAPAAALALRSETGEPKSAARGRRAEPVYQVLFVFVPSHDADAKPAAAAPAKKEAASEKKP